MTSNEDITTLFNKYCDWQSHNNRGTQIGIYSIAFLGLGYALRRVRPFKKFSKPQDIPNTYIKNRREITGEVSRIEPSGAVLMVKHMPIVKVPFVNQKNDALPVKIANVDINGLGINWLQSIVAGNEVTFIPLSKYSKYVLCEVNLTQRQPKTNKQQTIDLGESLCEIGFAKYENRPIRVNDIMHKIYIDRLKYAEERFVKREMGIKYYIEPLKTSLGALRLLTYASIMKLLKLIRSRFPQTKRTDNLKTGKQGKTEKTEPTPAAAKEAHETGKVSEKQLNISA